MKTLWKMVNEIAQPKEVMGSGKILALMNQKGGVGKTTMAFNMAHALSRQGKKVLCLDMDPQFNFSSMFGINPNDKSHIHHLLINSIKELKPLHSAVLLDEVIQRTESGIDVLPAGQELSGFELTVAGINSPRQLILKKFIEKNNLRAMYDFIVIDGPPTLGLLVVNILCAVDGVLYPFVPDSFSQQGLKNIQQVLEDIREMEICPVPVNLGYIPNLFDSRRKQVREDFEKMEVELGSGKIFTPFTNRVQFTKAQANRKSVFDFEAKDFKEIQDQFTVMAQSVEQELLS
ncbi:MAG: AAA family ATPase [Bacteriovoracaceae bacterium]|nr:AAA family ATPase [Bacteriovoracaceae bacterium]